MLRSVAMFSEGWWVDNEEREQRGHDLVTTGDVWVLAERDGARFTPRDARDLHRFAESVPNLWEAGQAHLHESFLCPIRGYFMTSVDCHALNSLVATTAHELSGCSAIEEAGREWMSTNACFLFFK